MEFPEENLYYMTQQKFYYSKKFRNITEYILEIPHYKLRNKKPRQVQNFIMWMTEYSSVQQTFYKYLSYARDCDKCWRFKEN